MDTATVFNLETGLTLVICFFVVQRYVANQVPQFIGPLWPLMAVLGPAWMITLAFLYRFLIWPAPSVAGRREAGVARAGALR